MVVAQQRQPASALAALHRIGPAYEQVAEQLRRSITSGELREGARLPTENELAITFGVSRATVREALRGLSGEGIIVTTKGPTGGSFVARPSISHVTDQFRVGMNLLARSPEVGLNDFHELRSLLEVPAARLAAERRTTEDMEAISASVPAKNPATMTGVEYYTLAKDFHDLIVVAAHNPLLRLAAEPMFSSLQSRLDRTKFTKDYNRKVGSHHGSIAEAIGDKDSDTAAQLMEDHLVFVWKAYKAAWIPDPDAVG